MFINFKSPLARQFAVVIVANLSLVSFGMNVSWGSPMLVKLRDEDQTVLLQPMTLQQESWVVSITYVTGIPSITKVPVEISTALIFTSFLGDTLGRKWTLFLTVVPRITMQIFVIFANDVWMLLCGRAISGIADAVTLGVVSTYCSESSGRKIRGASGTMTQILSAAGMLIMLGIGPFVSYLTITLIQLALIVLTYIPIMFIPESPYFLYMKGKKSQSMEVLTYLHGREEIAKEEIKLYATEKNISGSKNEKSIESAVNKEPGKWALLKDRTVLKSVAIILYLPLAVQLTGSNAVSVYLQTVFELTQTSISSEISSLIIGCIQLFACSVTFFITDKFGRKPIICVMLIMMAIGMFGLATFMLLVNMGNEVTGFMNFLPLISVALVIYGYNAGVGALGWIFMAELFDSSLRSYGMSICVLLSFVIGAVYSLVFPTILAGGSSIVFWIFGGLCIFSCLFIALLIPETKGRSFVEIQRAFGREIDDVDTKVETSDAKF